MTEIRHDLQEEHRLLDEQIDRAKGLATDLLACRRGALGHAWHRVQPDRPSAKGARQMAQQCSRCLAIKRYSVGIRYGEILESPAYEYPGGYLLHRYEDTAGPVISPQAVRAVFASIKQDLKPHVTVPP